MPGWHWPGDPRKLLHVGPEKARRTSGAVGRSLDLQRSSGHLRLQPCTSRKLHPLCPCAHGGTPVRASRQLAGSRKPPAAPAQPAAARGCILSQPCSGCRACSRLGMRNSSCPFPSPRPWYLNHREASLKKASVFPDPRFPRPAGSRALHRRRPPLCPAWLEGPAASCRTSKRPHP